VDSFVNWLLLISEKPCLSGSLVQMPASAFGEHVDVDLVQLTMEILEVLGSEGLLVVALRLACALPIGILRPPAS